MRYDPRTMRRLAMNMVVDELDRPIAFEADNKALYPFPTLAEDASSNVTALVGPGGTYRLDRLNAVSAVDDTRTGLENRSGGTHNSLTTKKHMYRRFVSWRVSR